ncbi:MAG: thiopurine S-methyltransferase, partial [Oleiphilaceae bacterium]
MEHEFWHERWSKKEIGFHEGSVNKFLYDHWPELSGDSTADVFVPLCGKAHDMWWLHDRGHAIIGVEL